jgi:hypothetical protein
MLDLMFAAFRKASESSLQMPLEAYKSWAGQLLSAHPFWQTSLGGGAFDWGRTFQRRWTDLVVESLHKHRESLDAGYRSAIQLVEQTLRSAEAKSPEDVRHATEEVWRRLIDLLKQQSEAQVRDFQAWAAKSMELQRASA